MPTRPTSALVAALLASGAPGCSGQATSTSAPAVASAVASAPVSSSGQPVAEGRPAPKSAARWVVRLAQETSATIDLGEGRSGLIEGGMRFVFAANKVTPANVPGGFVFPADRLTPVGDPGVHLQSVTARPAALGGGFLFAGLDGTFFADSFEAPLVQLSTFPGGFVAFGPRSALVMPDGLVSTTDAKPIDGAPAPMDGLQTHGRLGFLVATTSGKNPRAWFSADRVSWKPLTLPGLKRATGSNADHLGRVYELDDRLLLYTNSEQRFAIDARGKVSTKVTADEIRTAALRQGLPDQPSRSQVSEGRRLDEGWTLTGRSEGEWFGLLDRQPSRLDRGSLGPRSLGAPVGEESDDCRGEVREGAGRVTCVRGLARISSYRIDLATGAATEMPGFALKRPLSHRLPRILGPLTGISPPGQIALATCDGTSDAGLCVRNADGSWSDQPASTDDEQLVPFEGELVRLRQVNDRSWELRSSRRGQRTFTSDEVDALHQAMGMTRPSTPFRPSRFIQLGVLQTERGIRIFHTPHPSEQVTGAPHSFAVDLSFEPGRAPQVQSVAGVVVMAGKNGLRLDAGGLLETLDGWQSWHPVEPPPGRSLPEPNGARCLPSGCLFGSWARLGWGP